MTPTRADILALRWAAINTSISRMNATAENLAERDAAEEMAYNNLVTAVDAAGLAGTEHDPRTQGSWGPAYPTLNLSR
jgi:hypothetical protein